MIKHARQFLRLAPSENVVSSKARRLRADSLESGRPAEAAVLHEGLSPQDRVEAYINHGRWVADCACGAGMTVDGGWRLAYCLGCGAQATVLWPPAQTIAVVEALLDARPARFANWRPDEDVAGLAVENFHHGLGKGA